MDLARYPVGRNVKEEGETLRRLSDLQFVSDWKRSKGRERTGCVSVRIRGPPVSTAMANGIGCRLLCSRGKRQKRRHMRLSVGWKASWHARPKGSVEAMQFVDGCVGSECALEELQLGTGQDGQRRCAMRRSHEFCSHSCTYEHLT